jgi:hypothetical protein
VSQYFEDENILNRFDRHMQNLPPLGVDNNGEFYTSYHSMLEHAKFFLEREFQAVEISNVDDAVRSSAYSCLQRIADTVRTTIQGFIERDKNADD